MTECLDLSRTEGFSGCTSLRAETGTTWNKPRRWPPKRGGGQALKDSLCQVEEFDLCPMKKQDDSHEPVTVQKRGSVMGREPGSWVSNGLEMLRRAAGRLAIKREDWEMGNREIKM